MSKSHVHEFRGTGTTATSHTKDDPQTRHSKADALGDTEFELLVETTYDMEDYYGLQARFILFVCGRLGLRVGELAHMTEEWVDWRRNMICIPRHDRCTNGRDGGLCGQCRQAIRQMARIRTANQYAEAHTQLGDRDQYEPGGGQAAGAVVDESELADRFWAPKTEAAAREVAFDSVTRAEIVINRFFDQFDEWPLSSSAVTRRVKRMADESDRVDPDDLYPHALRATAASFWARHQIGPHALKSLMGWAQLSTSRKYISDSGERTAQAMRDVVM